MPNNPLSPLSSRTQALAAPAASFVVQGRVIWSDLRPASGLTIDVLDMDLRGSQPLGRATTDADGKYSLQYTATQSSRAEKDAADLVIRVLNAAGAVVASSAT